MMSASRTSLNDDSAGGDKPARKTGRRKRGGMPFKTTRTHGRDYEQEYPTDEYGAEMTDNARVWWAYLDEADEYDAEMINGFKDTTDVLLIFAGLFSAVVSTFVTVSSQALEPNYVQITASLMTELVSLQRAVASGTPLSQIPFSSLSFTNDDTTGPLDRWVNGLWLTSLTLSLVVALIAVLAKQWLLHYASAQSGTPRRRVIIRHFRFMGLAKWRVSAIIATLPVLLHISLLMFLTGLVLFIWPQDLSTAAVILVITLLAYAFYLISNFLAAFIPDCSYKTPISYLFTYLQQSLRFRITRKLPRRRARWRFHSLSLFGRRIWIAFRATIQSGKDVECKAAEKDRDGVLFQALSWLHSSSYNPRHTNIARFAFAGLPFCYDHKLEHHLQDEIEGRLLSTLREGEVDPEITACSDLDFLLRSRLALGIHTPTFNPLKLSIAYTTHNRHVALPSSSKPSWTDYINNLSSLISDKTASLPPSLWQALFEQDQYAFQFYSSARGFGPLSKDVHRRFLTLLLVFFKEASPSSSNEGLMRGANWTLPPTMSLVQLCRDDARMGMIILGFMCRRLLGSGSMHLRAIQAALDEDGNASMDSPLMLHLVICIMDGLYEDLSSTREESEAAGELLSACENTLFSSPHIPVEIWCQPLFIGALHRCREVQLLLRTTAPTRLTRYNPSHWQTPSLSVIMFYILDVLHHPWPLATPPPDLPDSSVFFSLMRNLCKSQDREAFQCFVDNDGLSVLRRAFPIDFRRSFYEVGYCCLDYVGFLAAGGGGEGDGDEKQLGEEQLQAHLDMIMQPENLAWLMFLAAESRCINLIQMIHTFFKNAKYWTPAADILVEELRRDAASGRVWFSYQRVAEVLREVKLDRYVLYGYLSPAIEGDGFPGFKSVDDEDAVLGDTMYGPRVVYTTCEGMTKMKPPQRSTLPHAVSEGWFERIRHVVSGRRIDEHKDSAGWNV